MAEIPTAEDARDGDMYGVFDELGDPVGGKADVDYETNDFGVRAVTAGDVFAGSGIRGIFGVDGGECYGEPDRECSCDEATDAGGEEDVTVTLGD